MPRDKVIGARVPRVLFDGARTALGLPEGMSESEVIRTVLAHVAGLSRTDHGPRPYTRHQNRQSA